jgi:hypothetical protein
MLIVMLAACGDDGEGAVTSPGGGPSETQPAAPAEGDGGNLAIVTIGGDTYRVPADPLNLCNSLDNLVFGSFAVGGDGAATQAGGTEVSIQVNFAIPVSDWEEQGLQPPGLDVDLQDEGVRWWASTPRGLGSVDSWELDDGRAVGEASFVAEDTAGNEVGQEAGSFEVVCR